MSKTFIIVQIGWSQIRISQSLDRSTIRSNDIRSKIASLGNPLSFERLTRIIRQIRARKKESLLLVQGQGGPGAVDGCIDWSSLAKRSVLSGPDLE
ncbi:Uncharacterized protein HZ326_2855 [Fusarium oxysporum f. sp. albedinis]|nr:Uncharacterized protein HZ326_2855 [Fusarium oxysporum f. sp. albedinis]